MVHIPGCGVVRFLITLALFSVSSSATMYWVATTGSDSNAGTYAAPFLTGQKAANTVAAGDTVIFKDGTYAPAANTCTTVDTTGYPSGFMIEVNTAGTSSAPIIFQAQHYRQAIFDGTLTCSYPVIVYSDYVVFDGFQFIHGWKGGAELEGTGDAVTNSEIHHNGNVNDPATNTAHVGILTHPASVSALLDRNSYHDNGRLNTICTGPIICVPHDQIVYASGTNPQISNSSWYNFMDGWGISIKQGSGAKVLNNTFDGLAGNGRYGVIVVGDGEGGEYSDFDIENNISINGGAAAVVLCAVALSGTNKLINNIAGPGTTGVLDMGTTTCAPVSAGLNTITNTNAPIGVVSAASLAPNVPVAPGSYLSIFGSNLAPQALLANSLPLPTALGGVQVLLGGRALPLNYVGPNQINAIVPYATPMNTIQPLTVIQDEVSSLFGTLVVAESQPAVFTQNQRGTGAGVIVVVKADGTQFPNTPSTPASAGDVLVIYCAGLGAVIPPVSDGVPSPSSPPARTVNTVTVAIGGNSAPVQFAGLTPGFAGLYQVNVTVPSDIAPSANVPVVISVAGASSSPVTVAIQ